MPLVFVLGVLVPVLEELFFRGVLFAALLGERGDKVKTAVFGSAALFAAFHILTPGGLARRAAADELPAGAGAGGAGERQRQRLAGRRACTFCTIGMACWRAITSRS